MGRANKKIKREIEKGMEEGGNVSEVVPESAWKDHHTIYFLFLKSFFLDFSNKNGRHFVEVQSIFNFIPELLQLITTRFPDLSSMTKKELVTKFNGLFANLTGEKSAL